MTQPRIQPARATPPGVTVVIGAGASERVEIAVLARAAPGSDEPFDADWLTVEVEVAAGVFAGRFEARFRGHDFVVFRDALHRLHASLAGEARFATMEQQLDLRLTGNGRGAIALEGTARHPTEGTNELRFAFSLDQTQLVQPLRQLDQLIARFPAGACADRSGRDRSV